MTDVILETRNLKKNFGKLEVLKGISTEIRRGDEQPAEKPDVCKDSE